MLLGSVSIDALYPALRAQVKLIHGVVSVYIHLRASTSNVRGVSVSCRWLPSFRRSRVVLPQKQR